MSKKSTPPPHAALQARFLAWYRKHAAEYPEHPDPADVQSLTAVLFQLAEEHDLALAQPTAEALDAVLGVVADDHATSHLEGHALDVLLHYLVFLSETSTWADSEDEYLACVDLISSLLDTLEDDERTPNGD